jgi:hypothetical protein
MLASAASARCTSASLMPVTQTVLGTQQPIFIFQKQRDNRGKVT